MVTRRRFISALVFTAVAAVSGLPAWSDDAPLASPSETGDGLVPLTIATRDGDVTFRVEVAATPQARQQGLMHRDSLALDRGMLFVFERPSNVAMWMKDTLISLDMLFITDDGRIVRIAPRTEPHSTQAIPAGQPVRGVLEINGGLAQRFGIREGDRVRHPAFAAAEPR